MEVRGIEMIIKFNDDFFVQWDEVFLLSERLSLGIFNFWIKEVDQEI